MKFSDVNNIWCCDLPSLSKRDQALVFFERAKVVIDEALADPERRARATGGGRFSRTYLISEIGCGAAAPTQNPRIRQLLKDTDDALRGRTSHHLPKRIPGLEDDQVRELKSALNAARQKIEVQAAEIDVMRSRLREAGWLSGDIPDHGTLPW